tara:strand:+ start:102 stop:926 length:825 start_codon:yes stop_codon:yes gene_type:complete
MAQRNYLNNKDLLKQIHLSKQTYCAYTHDKFRDYDLIVAEHVNCIDIEDLTDENKEEAITNRKKRLQIDKDIEVDVDPNDIVYRVYDFTHIPLEPGRKNKPKTIADHHAKVNFPPFKHYVWNENKNRYKEVARSHWKGTISTGKFNVEHGTITDELARMFMKLVERYATRSNWRGYTYVDEMRSQALLQLSQIALQFDESKSQNPFAYYTAAITNSFTRVLNVEKRSQNIRDDLLEKAGHNPSYTRQVAHQIAIAEKAEAEWRQKQTENKENFL